MKLSFYNKLGIGLILCIIFTSCEDFLEVDTPNHMIVSEAVFNNDQTALSAMTGIYNQLFDSSFSSGFENSVTVLGSLSADCVQYHWSSDLSLVEFDQNQILPSNSRILSLWSSVYNIIYMCNSLLEGLQQSNQISEQVGSTLEGEAKFIRAFTYFYLVNLYGDVPLILSTDYRSNSLETQVDQELIYEQILLDLTDAINLIRDEYRGGDRSQVNRFVALSMLARVHLYLENWEEAERLSSLVINNTNLYELEEDLNKTFLANSTEAIWQISPMGGGGTLTNTSEAQMFIIHDLLPYFARLSLTNDFVDMYQVDDKRFIDWVGYNEELDKHYAFKYKDFSSTRNITEYSMVLRLAEQYLIRAEARANQGDIPGAIIDVDKVRERAGLKSLSVSTTDLGADQVLEFIMEERQKELFAEWGHRWLDLKRTGTATTVLGAENLLFPIPEEERLRNPNLGQNSDY